MYLLLNKNYLKSKIQIMNVQILKCKKYLMLLLVYVFLVATTTTAQTHAVTGTVLSADDNEPLNGVTVQLKGSTLATTTDPSGNYRLTGVSSGSSLTFSFVGFKTKTIAVGGRSKIDISLEIGQTSLDQVVVIGYGTVKKSDLTGSVGNVNVANMVKAPVVNFAQALAGRVAGVQVNSSDGQPGGGINIMIRGAGSLTQSTTPLYVVDGFPIENLDPSTISSEEIASITILKDASSTAIYGSRGANGVVLIETKRGKKGKAVVSLSSSLGYQLVPKTIPLMSPYEFIKYQQELDPLLATTTAYFANGKTLEDYKNVQGINWQDQVFRTGIMQTYNLAIRGGSDDTKYSISGSLVDQKGVIINTGLGRYGGRITVDQIISKKIKTGISADYTQTHTYGQQIKEFGTNATVSALTRVWMYRPVTADTTADLLTDEGDNSIITTSDFRINPFIDLQNQYQHNFADILKANAYVSYSITRHLTFKSTAGIMQVKTRTERFYNSKTSQGSPINPGNLNGIWGSLGMGNNNSFSNENTLNYKNTFAGGHEFSGLLLFGVNNYKSFYSSYTGTFLPNEGQRMDGLDDGPSGTYNSPNIYNSINSMASYAARIDYNYKSRYLLTLNFRADGSSKFLDHWGYFPGGAIA
jgi:TonB-linked SusC/RagA family outer membrane protein